MTLESKCPPVPLPSPLIRKAGSHSLYVKKKQGFLDFFSFWVFKMQFKNALKLFLRTETKSASQTDLGKIFRVL